MCSHILQFLLAARCAWEMVLAFPILKLGERSDVRFSATVTTALGVVDGFGIGLCARYEPSEIHRGSKGSYFPSEIPSGIMFLWVT